jgi:hypothetical protein
LIAHRAGHRGIAVIATIANSCATSFNEMNISPTLGREVGLSSRRTGDKKIQFKKALDWNRTNDLMMNF